MLLSVAVSNENQFFMQSRYFQKFLVWLYYIRQNMKYINTFKKNFQVIVRLQHQVPQCFCLQIWLSKFDLKISVSSSHSKFFNPCSSLKFNFPEQFLNISKQKIIEFNYNKQLNYVTFHQIHVFWFHHSLLRHYLFHSSFPLQYTDQLFAKQLQKMPQYFVDVAISLY